MHPPDTSTVIRWLVNVQNTSALVAATFIGVHLAAPVAAAIAGEHAATQMMIVGRVWYQGIPNELILVYGSIGIHLTASLVRRTVLTLKTRRLSRFTAHQLTGYILIPFIAIHSFTNRISASSPDPPISSLSPSELDYSFVGYGLTTWPVVTYTLYAGLIGAGVWHALAGSMKVMAWLGASRTRGIVLPSSSGRAGRRIGLRGLYVALVGVLAIGLVRLHRDADVASSFTAKRMDAVYHSIPWLYRL